MKALKRTLTLPIFDQEVVVDVDFRVIEVVERTFDMSADAVIAMFGDTRRVQRHKVADVIVGWLAFHDLGAKRRDIREFVMRSSPDHLTLYVSSIYAALLFTLRRLRRMCD